MRDKKQMTVEEAIEALQKVEDKKNTRLYVGVKALTIPVMRFKYEETNNHKKLLLNVGEWATDKELSDVWEK